MTAIAVRGLHKRYGAHKVLRGVDLSVSAGTIFALLGPNGAGKTSTIEILEGYRDRDAGEVQVLGVDPARAGGSFRQRIGVMLEQGGVEPYLTVAEVLDANRGYYPDPWPQDDLLEATGLTGQATTRVRRLSAGQRRRLELALAVSGRPQLLFLDEPTLGFDPDARRTAWSWIRDLAAAGTTVMLTTNVMEEAQALADHLAILVDGLLVAAGTPAEVVDWQASTTVIRFRPSRDARTLPDELKLGGFKVDGGAVELRTEEPVQTLRELTGWALREGVALDELSVRPRSLEEAYLELLETARR